MRDTPARVDRQYRDLLLRRTGEERLAMGSSMNATARALVRAGLLARKPGMSEREVRRALFLCFYEREFSNEARERILAALDRDGDT
jgi:hypothetical protein